MANITATVSRYKNSNSKYIEFSPSKELNIGITDTYYIAPIDSTTCLLLDFTTTIEYTIVGSVSDVKTLLEAAGSTPVMLNATRYKLQHGRYHVYPTTTEIVVGLSAAYALQSVGSGCILNDHIVGIEYSLTDSYSTVKALLATLSYGSNIASDISITPFDKVTSTNVQSALEEVYGDLIIESGFADRAESTISFDDGTRTFTITPVSSDFTFWVQNEKYVKSSPENIQIPDTEGIHYIYYDGNGGLAVTDTFTPALITDYSLVCYVYWDATNSEAILFGDERHGRTMDSSTHAYLHNIMGTAYESGLALGNLDTDGNGDDASAAQLSVGNGVIRDEDIKITIEDGLPQELSPIAQIPIFYHEGASGAWRMIDATDYPVTTTGSGRAAWNEWTGATWQLTEVTNKDFVNMHIIATNDLTHQVIAIVGQASYTTLTLARDGAAVELQTLSYGPLDSLLPEWKPIATIIIQTSDGYSNAVKSRIRTVDSGADYIDWRATDFAGGTVGGITDHHLLSGLATGDDHTQYALLAGRDGVTKFETGIQLQNDASQTFETAHYQLSQSEIQALNSSPITLIAAPGAGKKIQIKGASAYYEHNGTSYSGGNKVSLRYSSLSGVEYSTSTSFITSASTLDEQLFWDLVSHTQKQNEAIVMTSGADSTGAGGTIDVYVQYVVIDTN